MRRLSSGAIALRKTVHVERRASSTPYAATFRRKRYGVARELTRLRASWTLSLRSTRESDGLWRQAKALIR